MLAEQIFRHVIEKSADASTHADINFWDDASWTIIRSSALDAKLLIVPGTLFTDRLSRNASLINEVPLEIIKIDGEEVLYCLFTHA